MVALVQKIILSNPTSKMNEPLQPTKSWVMNMMSI